MSKPPGVFMLLVAVVTGFSSYIVGLGAAGRDRVLGRSRPTRRPVKK